MQLRICDGGGESVLPASMEIVEQAFAPSMPLRIGTEITVAHGGRWLAALALEPGVVRQGEEPLQFLLSGGNAGTAVVTGRLGRTEVLRRFRRFIEGGPENPDG
jgi:hypothetical protein